MVRNRIELVGTVFAEAKPRKTPAGTPVIAFSLRVEGDDADPSVRGFVIPVVCLGDAVPPDGLHPGERIRVDGALTERRWQGPGGTWKNRFEVVAHGVTTMRKNEGESHG